MTELRSKLGRRVSARHCAHNANHPLDVATIAVAWHGVARSPTADGHPWAREASVQCLVHLAVGMVLCRYVYAGVLDPAHVCAPLDQRRGGRQTAEDTPEDIDNKASSTFAGGSSLDRAALATSSFFFFAPPPTHY